ncbi:MAG: hypothetical protein ACK5P6_09255 [Pseudobdellovibrionaceae bacterium]
MHKVITIAIIALACTLQARASELTNVELKTCLPSMKSCLTLTTAQSSTGFEKSSFFFTAGKVEIISQNSRRLIMIQNGFWDSEGHLLRAETVTGQEILWDLKTFAEFYGP